MTVSMYSRLAVCRGRWECGLSWDLVTSVINGVVADGWWPMSCGRGWLPPAGQPVRPVSDWSVERIAGATGFGTAANFRTICRREVGVTPTAYRKSHGPSGSACRQERPGVLMKDRDHFTTETGPR
ncbi:AraC family transcriptional regulator [Streptomyces sp. NPDC048825]|uniref:AraC family transcriptional regulator n=1 Tax=Streptomyces sp. NPDC048825 TaxID=3365592 RepID=UPI003714B771